MALFMVAATMISPVMKTVAALNAVPLDAARTMTAAIAHVASV